MLVVAGTVSALGDTGRQTGGTEQGIPTDSVRIFFRQSKIDYVPDLRDNQVNIDRITDRLSNVYSDTIFRLRHVEVVGGASPEGSLRFNKWLSEQRAKVLFNHIASHTELPDSIRTTRFLGRDWKGLIRLVKGDPKVPYREETLILLNDIVRRLETGSDAMGDPLRRIQKLRGGEPYRYMYRYLFPILRASQINLWYDKVLNPIYITPEEILTPVSTDNLDMGLRTIVPPTVRRCRPFYMDIRTNMLYDALALPNIGVEFYAGNDISVGGNWLYGWWKKDSSHRYWRAYGGELFGRWWFGKEAHEKPLTGHHIGIYGQMYTYDFEWGGKGEMGGKPGGNLWEQYFWGVGAEYGYSLPVARRINIDFSLGLGYATGLYHKYEPQGTHYVWQSTHRRHYFGPTKVEVALVWLIGCQNYNIRKGGVKK